MKISSTRSFIKTTIVGSIIFIVLFILHNYYYLFSNKPAEWKCPSGILNRVPPYKGKKTILFMPQWWYPYHYPFLQEANGFCPKCHFTEDQCLSGVSDGVVFHGMMLPAKIPQRPNPSQLWIFIMFETAAPYKWHPHHDIGPSVQRYDGLFNLAMTYRRDSDIFVPYGRFIPLEKEPRPESYKENKWAFMVGANGDKTYGNVTYNVIPSTKDFKNKKLAAWVVSRCSGAYNRRMEIVKELQNHMDIDIYGGCGDKKCEVPKAHALTGIDCKIQIREGYKFYLAFENGNCKDYVTEKFFDTLGVTDMVPVVLGGVDYQGMFPPKSFINVKDFRGAKELADYLKYLGENEEKWLEYFEWRKHYWVQNNRFLTGYCDLCEKIWEIKESHNETREIKTYSSMWNWWIYNEGGDEGSGLACEFHKDTGSIWKMDNSSSSTTTTARTNKKLKGSIVPTVETSSILKALLLVVILGIIVIIIMKMKQSSYMLLGKEVQS